MTLRALVFAIAAVLVPLGSGMAQTGSDGPEDASTRLSRHDTVCFRGRAAPRCRLYVLTEVAMNSREFGDLRGSEFHLQWNLGAMVNVTDRHAVGAALTVGVPHSGHWGGSARYRYWIQPEVAVDLAPGFYIVGNDFEGRRLRLTGQAGLSLRDLIGPFVHGESSSDGGQVGAGLRLGSWAGLAIGGALYVLFGLTPTT